MATNAHSPPGSPDEWISICERELQNISGAYQGKLSNDTKIDHALMATEAVLKAIIWKREGWTEWPKPRKGIKALYNHQLEPMLDMTKLRPRLRVNAERWACWCVLVNASVKQHRYSPTAPSDDEANAVAKAARNIDDGIVPWLLECYREMN